MARESTGDFGLSSLYSGPGSKARQRDRGRALEDLYCFAGLRHHLRPPLFAPSIIASLPAAMLKLQSFWNFDREHQAIGRSSIPVLNGASSRTRLEGRVHLDGVKSFGVEREVVGRIHASGVKRAVPAGGCER
jgi:hypothetical protein